MAGTDLMKAFENIDKDKTGKVARQEAVEIIQNHVTDFPVATLKTLLYQFDKNNDDMVDFKEFVDFYSRIKEKRTHLEKKFDEMDVDGSGDLDKGETVEIISEECVVDPMIASSLIDDFDVDKNGKLDKQEFMQMWTKLFG